MKEELRILYKIKTGLNPLLEMVRMGDAIDPLLDTALVGAAEERGWHCWASGVDLETGQRDLAFDRGEAVGALK